MTEAAPRSAAKHGSQTGPQWINVVYGEREAAWAGWIAERLRRAGYQEDLQQVDYATADPWALLKGAPVLFVLAEDYPVFEGFWNEKGPYATAVTVEEHASFHGPEYYRLDLAGWDEEGATRVLLERVAQTGVQSGSPRGKGSSAPFPGRPAFNFRPRAVSDVPSAADLLGFEPLIEGLYALLNDAQTTLPLAIAVTAPWGAGKSSVMRQLHRRLTEPPRAGDPPRREWYTVTFEAWKYERSERLWAALAKAIYSQPQEQMSWWQRVRFRYRLERGRRRWFWATAVVGPLVLTLGLLAAVFKNLDGVAAHIGGTVTVAVTVLAAVAAAWGTIADPFKRAIERYARQPRYEEQLGFTSEADREVSELTSVLTREGHGIVVFVDDLDRCSPRSLVDVVEAINQIFNSVAERPCVFVLGMDNEVVSSAIDVAYKDTVEHLKQRGSRLGHTFGISFLAKIVQVTVTVPVPSPDAMKRLLHQVTGRQDGQPKAPDAAAVDSVAALLQRNRLDNPRDVNAAARRLRDLSDEQRDALETAVKRVRGALLNADSDDVATVEAELLAFLERNPRQLKRFDNAFRLQLRVASDSRPELDFDRDQLAVLGKWVVLRLRWPDLAHAIDADPSLLGRLERHANGEAEAGDASVASWFEGRPLQPLLEAPPERRLESVHETLLQLA